MGGTAEIEWEYATVVDKSSNLVAAIAAELQLTQTQVDELFQAASLL